MPSAIDIKKYSRISPSAFISPFSDKPPIALYSSIAIKGENDDDCLPCSITSLNRNKLQRFLVQLAEEKTIIPQNSISSTTQVPVIPPIPSGSLEEITVEFEAEVGNFGVLRQITFERFDFISSPIFWTLNAIPGTTISITNMIITTDGQSNSIDWGDGTAPVPIVSGSPISKTYT
jgi:hypothetical protein